MEASNSPRILIARTSAIGDCLLTLPLVNALRTAYPESFIAWVVDCGAQSLLDGHPSIDQVIRVKKGWLSRPKELLSLRKTLRGLKFDLAIDPQGLSKSAILTWLSSAKRRIGFAAPQAREIAPWLYHDRVSVTATHLVDKHMELLTPLMKRPLTSKHRPFNSQPIDASKIEFRMPVREQAISAATEVLAQSGLIQYGTIAAPYCVINPGAGWASRLWDLSRYGRVAQAIADSGVTPLVVWGSDAEKQMAEEIVAQSNGKARLSAATNLLTLAEILRHAQFYLGSDTGPMHLSVSVGTPCVVLFGTTLAAESGPYGDQHIRLQKEYTVKTSRERRQSDNRSMLLITADEVIDACRQIMHKSNRLVA